MAVLVVEQGAGVTVRPSTLVTHMGLDRPALAPCCFGYSSGIQSLLLHKGEVQAGPPAQLLGTPRPGLLGSGLARLRRLAMGDLHVKSEAGLRGEGALAGPAGQLPLLLVHPFVVVELRGNAEGLATVVAAVTSSLRMDPAVVLQGKQVGVGFEAHSAVVDADGVGVFVIEEGAGMAVGAATLITSVKRAKANSRGGGARGRGQGKGEDRLVSEGGGVASSHLLVTTCSKVCVKDKI